MALKLIFLSILQNYGQPTVHLRDIAIQVYSHMISSDNCYDGK